MRRVAAALLSVGSLYLGFWTSARWDTGGSVTEHRATADGSEVCGCDRRVFRRFQPIAARSRPAAHLELDRYTACSQDASEGSSHESGAAPWFPHTRLRVRHRPVSRARHEPRVDVHRRKGTGLRDVRASTQSHDRRRPNVGRSRAVERCSRQLASPPATFVRRVREIWERAADRSPARTAGFSKISNYNPGW